MVIAEEEDECCYGTNTYSFGTAVVVNCYCCVDYYCCSGIATTKEMFLLDNFQYMMAILKDGNCLHNGDIYIYITWMTWRCNEWREKNDEYDVLRLTITIMNFAILVSKV